MLVKAFVFFGWVLTRKKYINKATIIATDYCLVPMKDKYEIIRERYWNDYGILGTGIICKDYSDDRAEIIEQIICDQEFYNKTYMLRED